MKAEHHIKVEHSAAAEHRKELRTNALADRMGRFMQTVKQRPKGRTLLIVSVLVVLAIVGIFWTFSHRAYVLRNSEMWKYLFQGDVDGIMQEYPDSKQGDVAQLQKDWNFLWDSSVSVPISVKGHKGQPTQKSVGILGGIANLKTTFGMKNPDEAAQAQRALFAILEEKYQEMYEKLKADPILGSEALYDKAVVQETMAMFEPKKLDDAKATYQKVRDEFKETARGILAGQRLTEVFDNADRFAELRQFYLDFGEHKLKKNVDEFE